jgi:sugar fermentation stimulation protein A
VVPLFSARANKAAEELVLPAIIPGLRGVQPEYTLENSRFDFFCVDAGGNRHLVEVKACSLVEHGVAMFPDAPSERALKHLRELAELCGQGYTCHLLFVIVHGDPRVFIPNLHTDREFAAALSMYGHPADPAPQPDPPPTRSPGTPQPGTNRSGAKPAQGTARQGPPQGGPVAIHACLLHCDSSGAATLARASVPVDLSHGELAARDSGNYLILLELPEPRNIETGALGTLRYKAGWYIYAGSARKNLSPRINRHLRHVRKKQHWHIDYLTPHSGRIKAYPIYSYRNLECELAAALEHLGGRGIPGFGSSDCRCKSHLFYFRDMPLKNPAFPELLLRCRHTAAFEREP